jgi:hypothetical protein
VPRVIIDSSKAENQGFEKYEGPTPPNGTYKALLKSAWWGMSKGGPGKAPVPMLTIVWEFRAKSEEKKRYDGFAMFQRITHQQSQLWKMQELFRACGQPEKSAVNVTEKDGPFGKVVTQIGRANVGKVEVLIKTKTEMYNGSERRAVDTLSPLPGTPDPEDLGDDEFADEEETSFEESASMTEGWAASANAAPDGFDDPWGSDGGSTEDPPF